jgi:hypothetical protein
MVLPSVEIRTGLQRVFTWRRPYLGKAMKSEDKKRELQTSIFERDEAIEHVFSNSGHGPTILCLIIFNKSPFEPVTVQL